MIKPGDPVYLVFKCDELTGRRYKPRIYSSFKQAEKYAPQGSGVAIMEYVPTRDIPSEYISVDVLETFIELYKRRRT